ncbi:YbbR-like domain-containing protein [Salipaludibacillus agaradhaerens]|uniref:YbbR-like domain-containing protein n=1 Tax=Salipaludibacillus agaradhaerens TaxID=76935 RepID=A0A9Q4B4W5_SALAG|nr:CdaR family protein [Salipaludibacillus agaradhaerens]MCR6098210.1 YbbR-like domain-containing protein [Salipaludibacillus agaradhaerens]MCR6116160.1 YbbR-like domain-containing protein [Salipaludibacillus agaradhaerens]
MDKWFNRNWFIKLSSLVIAIMLFLMVNMDGTPNQPGGIPGITDGSRVMEEVALTVYYDEENYVLTEAPETVQVTLRGPQNILTLAQVTQPQQEVYVDLTDKEQGVYYERVQHSGFPSDLTLSIVPMTVRVTIQEKQTVSFPVEVELINEGQMEEGYVVGTPEVTPSTVDITAAQGMIEQIVSAKAVIDLSSRDSSFEESVAVIFYDENGNDLELNADPPAVEVSVPVTSPNKEVPVRLGREGQLPDGMAIDTVRLNPENVTIYGPVEVINDITFVDLPNIDLSEISGDDTFELEVPLPDGVESVSPETVTVDIEVTEEEEREFSDFSIDVEGLEDNQSIEITSPDDGQFDLIVNGSSTLLGRLERSELQALLDVEGLEAGEHEANIEISGPQNLRFPQQGMTVTFIITETPRGSVSQANTNQEKNDEEDNNEEEEPEDDNNEEESENVNNEHDEEDTS